MKTLLSIAIYSLVKVYGKDKVLEFVAKYLDIASKTEGEILSKIKQLRAEVEENKAKLDAELDKIQ